jgi:hypothetical protein
MSKVCEELIIEDVRIEEVDDISSPEPKEVNLKTTTPEIIEEIKGHETEPENDNNSTNIQEDNKVATPVTTSLLIESLHVMKGWMGNWTSDSLHLAEKCKKFEEMVAKDNEERIKKKLEAKEALEKSTKENASVESNRSSKTDSCIKEETTKEETTKEETIREEAIREESIDKEEISKEEKSKEESTKPGITEVEKEYTYLSELIEQMIKYYGSKGHFYLEETNRYVEAQKSDSAPVKSGYRAVMELLSISRAQTIDTWQQTLIKFNEIVRGMWMKSEVWAEMMRVAEERYEAQKKKEKEELTKKQRKLIEESEKKKKKGPSKRKPLKKGKSKVQDKGKSQDKKIKS